MKQQLLKNVWNFCKDEPIKNNAGTFVDFADDGNSGPFNLKKNNRKNKRC